MSDAGPAEFYTGLVADLYGPLKSGTPDPARYIALVERHGGPALELGCGDGEPLLDLRRHGLDVEGVDASADMLGRCRRAAAAEGLPVTLHHQRMESLDLPRHYRTIFLAGPTFTLLPDDDTALRALRAIRAHLTDDGVAVIPLFVPEPAELGHFRETRAADGALIRVGAVSTERNESTRTQRTVLRYERHTTAEPEILERPWILHWYDDQQFRTLATAAGLHAGTVADELTYLLRRA